MIYSHLHLLIFRVVQRLLHHCCSILYSEELHVYSRSWHGVFNREVAVGDALAEGVAVATAGDAAQDALSVGREQGFAAEGDGSRVIEDEAAEFACDARGFDAFQSLFAEEIAL